MRIYMYMYIIFKHIYQYKLSPLWVRTRSVDKMITIDTVSFVYDLVSHQKLDGFLEVHSYIIDTGKNFC
jgi:hypothetical protein